MNYHVWRPPVLPAVDMTEYFLRQHCTCAGLDAAAAGRVILAMHLRGAIVQDEIDGNILIEEISHEGGKAQL